MKGMRILFFTALSGILLATCTKDSASTSNSTTSQGKSGSMAAMLLQGNYLYRLQNQSILQIFDTSEDSVAILKNSVKLGSGVETIYAHGSYLFFGTQTGMLIYDISTPLNPVFVSLYSHLVACDPVVVDGKYAYVTLRSGTRCNRAANQLEVIDISDINKPSLIKAFPMQNPHGLDVVGSRLILCDGDAGVKWLDISNPLSVNTLFQFNTTETYDVIAAAKDHFIVSAETGIYQFKEQSDTLTYQSLIPVVVK